MHGLNNVLLPRLFIVVNNIEQYSCPESRVYIFLDKYISEYIAKVFLYSSQYWSCCYTGKSELTYKDALASEKEALKQLELFPNCFKVPVLKTVHKGKTNGSIGLFQK